MLEMNALGRAGGGYQQVKKGVSHQNEAKATLVSDDNR